VIDAGRGDIKKIPYTTLPYVIRDGVTYLIWGDREIPLQIFGKHNLQNLNGAWRVCRAMGGRDEDFIAAAQTFKGASKRLQLLGSNDNTSIYKDFAHSPSKLKATISAVKELFPDRKLVACIELHTYSSLNINFLPQYRGCAELADIPIVYFSEHALQIKKLPPLSTDAVREAFGDPRVKVYNNSSLLRDDLLSMDFQKKNLLMMSSGDFDGIQLEDLASGLLKGR
jgi:UDP-N-acetylmuramate: L-alanyl-gamma-D-glutamyl-meso-diaminopimelate ligase